MGLIATTAAHGMLSLQRWPSKELWNFSSNISVEMLTG
jgi:hypothetical protein